MASPMKVTRISTRVMAPTTLATIQADSRLSVPCLSSSPQLGVGGGRPKPRESSAVSAVMPPAMEKGTKVISVETVRSEEHTAELQSRGHLVGRLLLETKKRDRVI